MAITYARAQAAVASGDNTDPSVASFGSAVTEGNLLVVSATERSGGSADNFVISDTGSNTGWTKRVSETTEQADTNARRTHVVWTRLATATDAAVSSPNLTITVDDGTAGGKMCMIEEFTAGTTVTWAFETVVVANTGTGSTSPLASGSTASVSGTLLLIGNAVWRLGTGGQTNIAFSGLGGVASAVGSNNGRSVASAWAQDETTGTKSTSVSWDGTGHEGNVALLVFSAVEPGGGGVTGTLSETQDNQTLAASGQIGYTGSLAETQADQTLSASGTSGQTVTGALAETQDTQTLAATGQIGYAGSLAETQADQTLTASGAVGDVTIGSLAETQDDQTSTVSGTVTVTGSLNVAQDAQTATVAGWAETTGTAAASQDDQTAGASGVVTVTVTGTLAATQSPNTLAVTGWAEATGTVAATQADQTINGAGFIGERVTPANRIYIVPAEDRTYAVPAEDRTYAVPAPDRTLVVT